MAANSIAGIVLAGGRSLRLGGRDKALLDLGGRTMLANSLARLRPQVTELAISTNSPLSVFDDFGLPLLGDRDGERKGPLAGILAGLDWARGSGHAMLASVAVDTPFFPHDLVARLSAVASKHRIAIAAASERLHPTFGLWPVSLAQELNTHLATTNDLSMTAFLAGHDIEKVDFAGPGQFDAFFNVNTPEQLEQAREHLRAMR